MRTLMTIFAVVFGLAALACTIQENTPPKVTLKGLPKFAKPGQMVKATIVVELAEGLHAYQNPPSSEYEMPLKVTCETKGVALKAVYPKGVVKTFSGTESAVYEGMVEIQTAFTMPKKAGKYDLKLSVAYQQCNESACFPPGKVPVAAKIQVKAGKG